MPKSGSGSKSKRRAVRIIDTEIHQIRLVIFDIFDSQRSVFKSFIDRSGATKFKCESTETVLLRSYHFIVFSVIWHLKSIDTALALSLFSTVPKVLFVAWKHSNRMHANFPYSSSRHQWCGRIGLKCGNYSFSYEMKSFAGRWTERFDLLSRQLGRM